MWMTALAAFGGVVAGVAAVLVVAEIAYRRRRVTERSLSRWFRGRM
jgi:hypothetical protein